MTIEEKNKKLLLRVEKLKKALRLGIDMREAQQKYFAKRSRQHLDQAKALEREFDELSEKVIDDYKQENLFQ